MKPLKTFKATCICLNCIFNLSVISRTHKSTPDFLHGCLHFFVSQSIDNWVQDRGDNGIKHSKKLIYRVVAEVPNIDEDAWAKEKNHHYDVSKVDQALDCPLAEWLLTIMRIIL